MSLGSTIREINDAQHWKDLARRAFVNDANFIASLMHREILGLQLRGWACEKHIEHMKKFLELVKRRNREIARGLD